MKFSFIAAYVVMLATAPVAFAQTTSTIRLSEGIPPDAPRITMPLTVSSEAGSNHGGSSEQVKSAEVPDHLREKFGSDFKYHLSLGKDPVGRSYEALLRPLDELVPLPSDNSRTVIYHALVLRTSGAADQSSEAEVLSSGTLVGSNSGRVPITYTFPSPLGINGLKEGNGNVSFSIHNSGSSEASGQASVYAGVTAQGSIYVQQSRLHATISEAGKPAAAGQQTVNLHLEPLTAGVPGLKSSGKLQDLQTLGQVKLAVDSVASDWSAITFAVVDGTVEEAATTQVEDIAALPAVSQVELYERCLMSTADLLGSARKTGCLLMIFGESQPEASQNYYGGPQNTMALTLSEEAILQTLQQAGDNMPALAFVVRSIAIKDLYSTQINKKPDYLVLSDFADATRIQFRTPPNPHQPYYHNANQTTDNKATLRSKLNLPPDKVSLVLFDANGKTLFLKADAGGDLQGALLEAIGVAGTADLPDITESEELP